MDISLCRLTALQLFSYRRDWTRHSRGTVWSCETKQLQITASVSAENNKTLTSLFQNVVVVFFLEHLQLEKMNRTK